MLQTVADALGAWEKAPLHVRAVAGAYVGPILAALVALSEEVEALKTEKKSFFPTVPHTSKIL